MSPTLWLWLRAFFASEILFIFWLLYSIAYFGIPLNMEGIAASIAATAASLIGLSLVLSSVSYFFDFADTLLGQRKYLGVFGWLWALLYSLSLLILHPQRYFYGFSENSASADFFLGLSAMTILTLMAAVSNTAAVKFLGTRLWRWVLRLGYVAYALLATRAYILEKHVWKTWLLSLEGLPPPRLVLTVVVIIVLSLRILMAISMLKSQDDTTS